MFSFLFLGDIVGRPGRKVVKSRLPMLRERLRPDVVIANGENSAGGIGIDPGCAKEIFEAGVDLITTGNHIWSKKDILPYLEKHEDRIVRPANYPPGAPGRGWTIYTAPSGVRLGVMNLIARVFMPEYVDCPFRAADELLAGELQDVDGVFVDFHGEATSEKVAMGHHLDGRVWAMAGTHTHVQTADARLLPKGSGYISDVGMCGPSDGVIGMGTEAVLQKFRTSRPARFEVADGPVQINGLFVEIDEQSKAPTRVERIYEIFPD